MGFVIGVVPGPPPPQAELESLSHRGRGSGRGEQREQRRKQAEGWAGGELKSRKRVGDCHWGLEVCVRHRVPEPISAARKCVLETMTMYVPGRIAEDEPRRRVHVRDSM